MIDEILTMFMVYSVIGWLWETPFVSFSQKRWINRGFLHGPVIPIYGFAAVTMMISMRAIEPYVQKLNFFTVLFAILYMAVIASFWEYITSYLLEKLFHTRWWDYSERKFNLNGRIALDCSIGWGIGGYFFWQVLNNALLMKMRQMPKEMLHICFAVFYTLLIIDSCLTVKELLSLKHIMNELYILSEQLSDKVIYRIENLNLEFKIRKQQFKNTLEEVREELKLFYEDKTYQVKVSIRNRKRELGESILLMMQRKETSLSEEQRGAIERFNRLLEVSKNFSRFYKNYPKATSLKFKSMLPIVRIKKKQEK